MAIGKRYNSKFSISEEASKDLDFGAKKENRAIPEMQEIFKSDSQNSIKAPVSVEKPAETEEHTENNENVIIKEVVVYKKGGRPKTRTGEYKRLTVELPQELISKMRVASVKYQNNVTKYLEDVIKKDMETNYSEYKKLYDMLTPQ